MYSGRQTLYGQKLIENILSQEIELGAGNFFLTNGTYNLIPYRRANGKSLIPLGEFETSKTYTKKISKFKPLKIYDGNTLILCQYEGDAFISVYVNKLPEETSSDLQIPLDATVGPFTKINWINTNTQTVVMINDKIQRKIVASSTSPGGYLISDYSRKDFPNIKQAVQMNGFYFLRNDTRNMAITESMADTSDIDPDNIITLPVPETEKVLRLEVVNNNRLLVFTTNYKLEYIGMLNSNTNLPITRNVVGNEKYSLVNDECTVTIADVLFTLGSKEDEVATLNVYTGTFQNVFQLSKNNFLISQPDKSKISLESIFLYDYTHILINLGLDKHAVLFTPSLSYSSAIFPKIENSGGLKFRISEQFALQDKKYFYDPLHIKVYTNAIKKLNKISFSVKLAVSANTRYVLEASLITLCKIEFTECTAPTNQLGVEENTTNRQYTLIKSDILPDIKKIVAELGNMLFTTTTKVIKFEVTHEVEPSSPPTLDSRELQEGLIHTAIIFDNNLNYR